MQCNTVVVVVVVEVYLYGAIKTGS